MLPRLYTRSAAGDATAERQFDLLRRRSIPKIERMTRPYIPPLQRIPSSERIPPLLHCDKPTRSRPADPSLRLHSANSNHSSAERLTCPSGPTAPLRADACRRCSLPEVQTKADMSAHAQLERQIQLEACSSHWHATHARSHKRPHKIVRPVAGEFAAAGSHTSGERASVQLLSVSGRDHSFGPTPR